MNMLERLERVFGVGREVWELRSRVRGDWERLEADLKSEVMGPLASEAGDGLSAATLGGESRKLLRESWEDREGGVGALLCSVLAAGRAARKLARSSSLSALLLAVVERERRHLRGAWRVKVDSVDRAQGDWARSRLDIVLLMVVAASSSSSVVLSSLHKC